MNQQIPITTIEDHNSLIIDATQHNSAVRLAKGKFQRLRRLSSTPLILLFLLAPWLTLNGSPILWMDLDQHVLHLMGFTFWPEDLLMLTWVAMASAFALFIAANVAGRIWCGFSCPQTVWSMMFIWVEDKIEGSRNQRLKELNKPLHQRNLLKFLLKHSAWLLISCITGFTFVAYFETGNGLWNQLINFNVSIELAFWLGFFSLLTYINAGWLREQVCLHMCPYSRFQSVMVDQHTLKVSYDTQRGEPRKLHQKMPNDSEAPKNKEPSGDCINCQLCVQVCPVGIDIRQGLQYACIDCGACIDACDDIMQRIEKPTGLIRFSPEPTQSTRTKTKSPMAARPRLWGYGVAFIVSVLLFAWQVSSKAPYAYQFNRDRAQLYTYNDSGISNAFILSLQNKTLNSTEFQIAITHPDLVVSHQGALSLSAGLKADFPLQVICPEPCQLTGRTPFELQVRSNQGLKALQGVFFSP